MALDLPLSVCWLADDQPARLDPIGATDAAEDAGEALDGDVEADGGPGPPALASRALSPLACGLTITRFLAMVGGGTLRRRSP